MKARVCNLIKTEAAWSKLNFTPLPGELVIYAPDTGFKFARIKIGDGVHSIQELPFIIESVTEDILADYKRAEQFDAGRITEYLK